jgi:DNA-binding NtrC family response regulator
MSAPTGRARELTVTVRGGGPEGHGLGESGFLLVLEAGTSRLVPLPAAGELAVTLGRGPEAQVRLASPAVSRSHARIEVRGGEPWVVDLGNHNGILLNGERITAPQRLRSGDSLGLCDVTVLYYGPAAPRRVRPLHPDLGFLRDRLDEELERAARWLRSLALLVIEAPARAVLDAEQVAGALAGLLSLSDVAALDGPQRLLVLRPDCDEAAAAPLAERLLAAITPSVPGARAGYAVYPGDGPRADVLLVAARAAAAQAAPAQVLAAGAAISTLRIGDKEILIADPAMLHLYALIRRLAPSELSVLIYGETGSGKELAAMALHALSPRSKERLLSLNCAALPESLAESELFGHERGAFSGAVASKPGLLESAPGGTVFLDEIGELPLAVQAKLLRVLETRKLMRVGDTRERPFSARIIAATNRNLDEEIARGRFRQDLYFRISPAVLHLPPLRARPRELPLLARSFLREARALAGLPAAVLSPAALERLMAYLWPGNVRELKGAMDYASAIAQEDLIEPVHLPEPVQQAARPAAPSDESSPTVAEMARVLLRLPLGDRFAAIDEALLAEALTLAAGNKSAAARLLGVHRKVIERRMARQGARDPAE